jgi:hypothetical protein
MKHWGDFVAENIGTHGPIVVGIDPGTSHIPSVFRTVELSEAEAMENYVAFVLESLSNQARFVKFQSAFFEAYGSAGIVVLSKSIRYAKKLGFGVILDAKRGDIGSTVPRPHTRGPTLPPMDRILRPIVSPSILILGQTLSSPSLPAVPNSAKEYSSWQKRQTPALAGCRTRSSTMQRYLNKWPLLCKLSTHAIAAHRVSVTSAPW